MAQQCMINQHGVKQDVSVVANENMMTMLGDSIQTFNLDPSESSDHPMAKERHERGDI